MTPSLVLDCSITMTWCFDDEKSDETDAILFRLKLEFALVPSLWFLEVANVLNIAYRRNRITDERRQEFLRQLSIIQIEVDETSAYRAFDHLLPLSRKHGLTVYDAAYLDLAIRRQLPLASLDERLRSAAEGLGLTYAP